MSTIRKFELTDYSDDVLEIVSTVDTDGLKDDGTTKPFAFRVSGGVEVYASAAEVGRIIAFLIGETTGASEEPAF